MSPSQRGDVAPRTTAGNHLRSNNHSVTWLLQPQRIVGGWPREETKKLFAAASRPPRLRLLRGRWRRGPGRKARASLAESPIDISTMELSA